MVIYIVALFKESERKSGTEVRRFFFFYCDPTGSIVKLSKRNRNFIKAELVDYTIVVYIIEHTCSLHDEPTF